MIRIAVAALIVAAVATTLSAQVVRVTEAQARAILKENMDSLNDPKYVEAVKDLQRSYFLAIFAQAAKEHAPDFTGDPVVLVSESGLQVTAVGPALSFASTAAERLRLLDPNPKVAWRNVVDINIHPSTISAPDIIKVVLRRGTGTVEPLASTLSATKMTTAMGATRTINKGIITFPLSAFSGTEITQLLLIPREGQNITYLFSQADFKRIQ